MISLVEASEEVSRAPRGLRRLRLNEAWLLRLRWVAVVGQFLTIVGAAWLAQVQLQWTPLLAVIGFTAITNAVFAVWLLRQPAEASEDQTDYGILFAVMTLDLLSLTALLFWSGGPANPFSVFYLVNLGLAAVLLPAKAVGVLTVVAVGCLSGLHFSHTPLPELDLPLSGVSDLTLRELGNLVAFPACAVVLCYFITRVTRELQDREVQLRIAEQQQARSARLEALATLAAGAGHELASPLSTIAVIANDLSRHLEGTAVPESVVEDVQLIRSELDYCRRILDGLASGAGQVSGEELQPLSVRGLVQEVVGGIRRRDRVEIAIEPSAETVELVVPKVGTAQAIRGIVRNALDASGEPVLVRVGLQAEWVEFSVVDRGHGMSSEVLSRIGEPFFTTKEPGQGMGLGLFLTRNVVERLEGRMEVESRPGDGTTVTIRLPRQLA